MSQKNSTEEKKFRRETKGLHAIKSDYTQKFIPVTKKGITRFSPIMMPTTMFK
jgi:hypothetical protein